MIGAQVLLIVSVQFWFGETFLDTQALPRNRGAYVDTQNWHDEGFLDNLGRTGQTSPLNWSDRSRQVCQIANWTVPLRRSRRDDRNAYMEHPIWHPDEEVMPPVRPAPVRPV